MTITIDSLQFGYDDRVLDGVDLSVSAGELVGLLGPNGSGKSTLLECALGLLDPDSGSISVDGDSVDSLDSDERASRIGYVPQSESRAFPATVFETILQGRRPHGGWSPGDRDREAVQATIERLGLDGLATRNLGELSGGQRQKVRLGRALVGDPDVLVLDEPTSALDLNHRLSVMDEILTNVREGPVAGLIAIHDVNLASRYCDRVALLSEGTIHAVGDPDVLTPARIRTVYGVQASVCEHRDRRLIVPEAPVDASRGPDAETDCRPDAQPDESTDPSHEPTVTSDDPNRLRPPTGSTDD